MRALTIRQPWAGQIHAGRKLVENRGWRTDYRGPLAIHAAATVDKHAGLPDPDADVELHLLLLGQKYWRPGRDPVGHPMLALGAIVAVAQLVDVHPANRCCAPWGQPAVQHWVLADVQALPEPIPCRGSLGLWTPPEDITTQITAASARG